MCTFSCRFVFLQYIMSQGIRHKTKDISGQTAHSDMVTVHLWALQSGLDRSDVLEQPLPSMPAKVISVDELEFRPWQKHMHCWFATSSAPVFQKIVNFTFKECTDVCSLRLCLRCHCFFKRLIFREGKTSDLFCSGVIFFLFVLDFTVNLEVNNVYKSNCTD